MNSSFSYCLIVNEASNSGRAFSVIQNHWNEIKSTLGKVELYKVDSSESISKIAKAKSQEFDVVVACGGDGTARKVAIGLKDSDALFGIFPAGTGNDFARMMGYSKSISENLKILTSLNTQTLDLISFNDSYFINTLGIGFDGRTNFLASRYFKLKGSLKYVLAGIQSLFSAKPFIASININGKKHTYRTLMVIIANGKWEGGRYLVSPESNNSDGLIELIVLNDLDKLSLAIEFVKLSLGKKLSPELHSLLKAEQVTLNASFPVHVHADGEVEEICDFFEISVSPFKLNVICKTL